MKYENNVTDSLPVSSSLSAIARAELSHTVSVLVEVKNLIAVGEIDEAYNILEDVLKEPTEGVH